MESRRVSFEDVSEAIRHLHDADILEQAKHSRAIQVALEIYRPRNWWGVPVPAHELAAIAEADGIPLAWVPRGEIVLELAGVANRDERMRVLADRESDVLADCEAALTKCTEPELSDRVPLAKQALAAFREHHEAAMALAVALGEPLATRSSRPRVLAFGSEAEREAWEDAFKNTPKYKQAEVALSRIDPLADDSKWRALAAPIPKFFTTWFPSSGAPAPKELSRHVVAHQPTVEHFSRQNALISVMLMTSLLREQEDWIEEVQADIWEE